LSLRCAKLQFRIAEPKLLLALHGLSRRRRDAGPQQHGGANACEQGAAGGPKRVSREAHGLPADHVRAGLSSAALSLAGLAIFLLRPSLRML
jgi:hypothetical protein